MKPSLRPAREHVPMLDPLPTDFAPPPVPRTRRPAPLALVWRLARTTRMLTADSPLRRGFNARPIPRNP